MKIAILGGGLSGLSVTKFFQKYQMYEITIFEKEKNMGGLARTWNHNNDKFDFGPHFFHSKYDFILDVIKPEINDISYPVDIYAKSIIKNKLYDYPVSIDNILVLPKEIAINVIDELYKINKEDCYNTTTFEEYVTALIGNTLFDIFFRRYTEQFWGISVSDIPKFWAEKRISFRKNDKRFFSDEWCVYFNDGIEELIKYIKATINAYNICDIQIKKIDCGKRFSIITNKGKEEFDGIVSTIPITQLLEYIGSKNINDLGYRSMIVMYQKIFREKALPADAIYFSEGKYVFTRIFERNRFVKMRQFTDTSSITIDIPYSIKIIPDGDLVDIVHTQLIDTGLYERKDFGNYSFVKQEYVYPIHTFVNDESFQSNFEELKLYKNIYTTGRLGMFKYMNMDETIMEAKGVVEEAHKEWSNIV